MAKRKVTVKMSGEPVATFDYSRYWKNVFKVHQEAIETEEHYDRLLGALKEPGRFETMARDIGRLCDEKNASYGSSFSKSGDILAAFYPNGVTPEQLPRMLFLARVIDKLFRLATDPGYGGEDPVADLVGYGLLELERIKSGAKESK